MPYKNKDKQDLKKKEWRDKNKEKIRKYNKEYQDLYKIKRMKHELQEEGIEIDKMDLSSLKEKYESVFQKSILKKINTKNLRRRIFFHLDDETKKYIKKMFIKIDRIFYVKKRTKINKEFIQKYKNEIGCQKCGKKIEHFCLDFHHKDPSKKEEGISLLLRLTNLKKIKKEIGKCELLCANCHSILHRENENHYNMTDEELSILSYKLFPNLSSRARGVKRRIWRARRCVYLYKLNSKCCRCGENNPNCLVFHHRDGDTKEDKISSMVNHGGSINKIKEEIDKCDIYCTNCHRKKHKDLFL
jgi:hypothetical protein